MNSLQGYYSIIDNVDFKELSNDAIINLLPKIEPSDVDYHKALLENNAFIIRKSINTKENLDDGTVNGLSWVLHSKDIDIHGNEIDIYTPDVRVLTVSDYEYFEQRFLTCSSLFPKTEYGLLVYFGQKTPYSKRNDFKKELADKLIQLAQIYWDKALVGGDRNYNFQNFFPILETVYFILHGAKLTTERDILCLDIIAKHNGWSIERTDTLRGILDLSRLMIDHYSIFKVKVNFEDVIKKNITAAKEIEKTYTWGAIYIVDNCISIRQKLNIDFNDLLYYKAQLFEKMANERSEKFVCLRFIENALRIYQSLKDDKKITEIETIYASLRSQIEMNHEKFFEFQDDYIKERTQMIKDMITSSDNQSIVANIASCNWFGSIEKIQEMANNASEKSLLASMASTDVLDKYGNTIDKYNTEEEIQEMHFWESFGFSFQIGIAALHEYIIEAYNAKKLSFESVISYIESTWYNEPIIHTYHGQDIELRILDVIKPGLKRYFEELWFAIKDMKYNSYDNVMVIDTLTLKMETILRFMCERLNIATFKTRDKGGVKLVMEKLLDDMLSDLKDTPQKPTGFQEEDRLMLKYVLTIKGLNLRNRVAHGLMDLWEYSFGNSLIILYLIIKLSAYKLPPVAKCKI